MKCRGSLHPILMKVANLIIDSAMGIPDEAKPENVHALTEAVHEIGHLLGIGHCPEPTCVMHFSNSLYDTDRKSPMFCGQCEEFLL